MGDELNRWWMKGQTEDLREDPWLHPAVNLYLDHLLQPEWRVFEHGAGGSTLWLAERVKTVYTIEHDPDWLAAVKAAAPSNVTVADAEVIEPAQVGDGYDLALIDGERMERPRWVEAALEFVRPGGIIVFDNSNRPEFRDSRLKLMEKAAHFVVFDVNPPGHRYAVTDFYRLRGGDPTERFI